MSATRSLIAPSANPLLERALQEKLQRRSAAIGSLGELEPLALRLGLMMNTLKPSFVDPQLIVFAADHGIAVEGLTAPGQPTTAEQVEQLLAGRWPMAVYARTQGLDLSVVDCGIAADMRTHDRLLMRKIAHGTRNPRAVAAMTVDQAHAAMRAGMEIGSWPIVGVSLAVSLLTLLSMVKIWNEAFWKAPPTEEDVATPLVVPAEEESLGSAATFYRGRAILLPAALLATVSVMMGLAAGPLFELALSAGEELSDPTHYVEAVLGGAR